MTRDLGQLDRDLASIQRDPRGFLVGLAAIDRAGVDDAGRAERCRLRAIALSRCGDRSAVRWARRAVALSAADNLGRAVALVTLAWVEARWGSRGLAAVTQARDALDGLPVDGLLLGEFALALSLVGEEAEASRVSERALVDLRRRRLSASAAGVLVNLAVGACVAGDPSAVLRRVEEIDEIAGDGLVVAPHLRLGLRAYAAALEGWTVEALELYEDAVQSAVAAGVDPAPLRVDRVEALLRGGAAVAAIQASRMLLRGRLADGTRVELEVLAALAERQVLSFDAAEERCRRALVVARRSGRRVSVSQVAVALAEIRLALGGATGVDRRRVEIAVFEARRSGARSLAVRAQAALCRIEPGRHRLPRTAGVDREARAAVGVARVAAALRSRRRSRVRTAVEQLIADRRAGVDGRLLAAPSGAIVHYPNAAALLIGEASGARDNAWRSELVALARALVGEGVQAPDVTLLTGSEVLVELFVVGRDLLRATTVDGVTVLASCCRVADALALAGSARTLRHLAARHQRASEASTAATAALDRLLALTTGAPAGAPLRVAVPGVLAAAPLSAFASLQERVWALAAGSASTPPRRPGPLCQVTVLTGPALPNGLEEARLVTDAYATSGITASSAAASLAAVRAALAGPGIVHLAAHAARRGDDPTLTWLDCTDGALTARALSGTRVEADVVVLSACDAAVAEADTSAGVVNLATTLIRRGAPRVIASTELLAHDEAAAVAAVLHERLAAGEAPEVALTGVRQALPGLASAFVCLAAW